MGVGLVSGARRERADPTLRPSAFPARPLAGAALVLAARALRRHRAAHGSGFLAVFIAGLSSATSRSRTSARSSASRARSPLAEIVVFVALGLTIDLGGLSASELARRVVLALVLALLVRPLVVAATLALAGYNPRDAGSSPGAD